MARLEVKQMSDIPNVIIPSELRDRNRLPRVTSNMLIFDPEDGLSSWNTLPLFGGTSLEAEVAKGDKAERDSAKFRNQPFAVEITINSAP